MEGLGVILLMGMTGSGKSTFISRLKTSDTQIHIGHGLESKTADLALYEANSTRRRVILADTPGFDDTVRSDTDVLESIAKPLCKMQQRGNPVLGVIYLHNITNPRLSGTAVKTLKILQQFCGEKNYKKIVFATTMWEDAKFTPQGEKAADQRHGELKQEYWDGMFKGNGGVVRHLRDEAGSAGDIIDRLLNELDKLDKSDRERPLRILKEMDTDKKPIEQTSAYWCAQEEQRLLRQQKEQKLAELERQLKVAKDGGRGEGGIETGRKTADSTHSSLAYGETQCKDNGRGQYEDNGRRLLVDARASIRAWWKKVRP